MPIVFPVTAACDDEISDLKELIRSKRALGSLKAVGPHTLELWKASATVEGPLCEMTLLSQLKKSITAKPAGTLIERIGLLGHDLSKFADKLDPSKTVFSIFPTQPPRDYIHIIVKVPRTSE